MQTDRTVRTDKPQNFDQALKEYVDESWASPERAARWWGCQLERRRARSLRPQ